MNNSSPDYKPVEVGAVMAIGNFESRWFKEILL